MNKGNFPMSDLFGDFVADVRDGYERAAPQLARWVEDPSDRAALDAVFRFVHTVRGNAGFLDLERFERLCDGAERGLAEVRDGTREADADFVKGLATIVIRIGELADAVEAGVGLSDKDEPGLVRALGYAPIERRQPQNPGADPAQRRMRTVRIPTEQFEVLATSMEEVEAGQRELLQLIEGLEPGSPILPAIADLSMRISAMARALTASRQQPVARILSGLDAMAAQLAQSCGKLVQLEALGGEIMFDREVVDGLRDPLLHIVRNALGHGIEPPEDRQALGKAAMGRIRVRAQLSGDDLVVTVADDGRGADQAALDVVARQQGIEGGSLADLLTKPGVSTAREVTALSGHGVGLDAVARRMALLDGSVAFHSLPGEGMIVTLRAPSRARARAETGHAA